MRGDLAVLEAQARSGDPGSAGGQPLVPPFFENAAQQWSTRVLLADEAKRAIELEAAILLAEPAVPVAEALIAYHCPDLESEVDLPMLGRLVQPIRPDRIMTDHWWIERRLAITGILREEG
jgi:hypothetical protein